MIKPRHFSDESLDRRMIQAWIVLVGRAHNRQTITYAELARLMQGKTEPGKRDGQWPGMRLGQIYTYCEQRGLPLLPVIVVSKKTGLPADLAPYKPNGKDPDKEREKVFNFDWFALCPPNEADVPA